MRPLGEIAVGFADTPAGRDALALGERLARTVGAELRVVRVRHDTVAAPESAAAELRAEAIAELGEATRELRASVLVERSAAKALRQLAEADPALGMLVLGATHRAGIGRVVPGGVADRLLAGVPCALAIAPPGFADAADNDRLRVIAVGFDGSTESSAALAVAVEIATAAEATMRVIAVSPPVYGSSGLGAAAAPEPQAAQPAPVDLQSRLHDAVATLPEQLRTLAIHEHGAPAHWLIEHSQEGVDLLVMGSRGHGPVGSALVGATSNAVLGEAECPVVVVPRPALGSATAT